MFTVTKLAFFVRKSKGRDVSDSGKVLNIRFYFAFIVLQRFIRDGLNGVCAVLKGIGRMRIRGEVDAGLLG